MAVRNGPARVVAQQDGARRRIFIHHLEGGRVGLGRADVWGGGGFVLGHGGLL